METLTLTQQTFEDFLSTRQEPEWLKEYRRNNFEAFSASKLPQSLYTNLPAVEKLLNVPKEKQSSYLFSCSQELKRKGLIAVELSEALKFHESALRNFLEKEIVSHDKFELFANAFFTEGYFVFVPKGIGQKETIAIDAKIHGKEMNALKSVVAIEEQSNAVVLEKINAEHASNLNAYSSSIFLGQASDLDYFNYCDLNNDLTHISSKRIFQERDSKLNSFYAWFGGRQTLSRIKNHLKGQGAELLHSEMAFGKNKEHYDFNSDIFHEVPETTGKITFKAVLDDFSSSIFDGMIKIYKNAQVTNSFLEAHSILLSKNSSSNNIPGLEIEANDVRATHSASVHKIDDEQLFYLNSRGIPPKEAEKMIVLSFFEALTNRIKEEGLREIFNNKLEEKYK